MDKDDQRAGNDAIHPVNRSVVVVVGTSMNTYSADEIDAQIVGVKACGLLRVPEAWVPPFFVVHGSDSLNQEVISRAAQQVGIETGEVYVRSNGTLEGLDERGSLDSGICALADVATVIATMQASEVFKAEAARQNIHFIVQSRLHARDQGHLSNERRISRHPRDWRAEADDGTVEPVGVRLWRDKSSLESVRLECTNRASVTRALRAVAAWAKPNRAHFEWIWDGAAIWIVQLDFLPPPLLGVKPADLVTQTTRPKFLAEDLSCFVPAETEHFASLSKLNNAKIYSELGYNMPQFYVLDDPATISDILAGKELPSALLDDLARLCSYPFVLRTQASGVAKEHRQMLPRSDELRSPEAAADWLSGPFRIAMGKIQDAQNVALIGHHFIPATASAWAQARPDERRVRIESLWGIPEGAYYFAHDVYDVDTGVADIADGRVQDCKEISARERYKGKFIAPNDAGEWVVQQTDESSDWSRSVKKKAWLQEIAWTTRRIAAKVGHPVVVMWFVDVPAGQSLHQVLPWYHEEWKAVAGGYKKARPTKKNRNSEYREISRRQDWERLLSDVSGGAQIERVFVNPADSEIVRDRAFVEQLAAHANEHGYIVELSGGLLSHAFYMLNRAGCNVECIDLFGVQEEQLEFNKLVRDLIPAGIAERGEQVEIVKLSGDALVEALRRKIVEEVYEVADARGVNAILEEIADVEETIDAMLAALGVKRAEVQEIQKKKRERRGGFADGTMLLRTSLAAPIAEASIDEEQQPIRVITKADELPSWERDFHVDQRRDVSGLPERQLTLTLPSQATTYDSGFHNFDLATTSGEPHRMIFSATVERKGVTLKVKVRLSNAAVQLTLPFDDIDP
ncbi:nucleoside triphosphate pyrophosphohydrolase [Xanthomonas sp. NCPPB 2632]|uniref:nucleoside triphosphate pyrophosphohydrolase n=1 Tax=Xanthomonas sp. NCPPB 2632 TaxID=3240912 RepID=UPI003519D6D3